MRRKTRALFTIAAGKGFPITKHDRQLSKLHNKYKGQRCFVLGNGPSLKRQNIGLLKDEFVFVTNSFFLHEEFASLNHCFYCVSDPIFWGCRDSFDPKFLESISQKKDIVYFININIQPIYQEQQINFKTPVFFVRVNTSKKVWKGIFSTNVLFETYWGCTVIIDICLPMAFYLGFDRIYLLGCDCDYRLNEAKDFSKSYFYDVSELPKSMLEAMCKSRDRGGFEYSKEIPDSYQIVKKYFEDHGRKIYNAGYGGKLDIFERVNYEDII
jgi:hypothetical protein